MATPSAASTTMEATIAAFAAIILDCMLVVATLTSASLSLGSTSSPSESSTSRALAAALRNPETITIGWTPLSKSSSARSSRAPARTTTEVVPSPTPVSVALETSTRILAAGCWMAMSFSMVAPSLVMVVTSYSETSILSIPWGPREVRTMEQISLAAATLFAIAPGPFIWVLPSRRGLTGPDGPRVWTGCADIGLAVPYLWGYRIFVAALGSPVSGQNGTIAPPPRRFGVGPSPHPFKEPFGAVD